VIVDKNIYNVAIKLVLTKLWKDFMDQQLPSTIYSREKEGNGVESKFRCATKE